LLAWARYFSRDSAKGTQMEKKFEITGPVGNADIQKRIRQLALAYALSPPENPGFELAKWRTIAEFSTEALRLSRLSNETGAWGPGLFGLGIINEKKAQQKRPQSPAEKKTLAGAREKAAQAKIATKDAKKSELTRAIADLFKDTRKAKWANEDIRDQIHPTLSSWPSFTGQKIWTPSTTLANIKPIAKMLRNAGK